MYTAKRAKIDLLEGKAPIAVLLLILMEVFFFFVALNLMDVHDLGDLFWLSLFGYSQVLIVLILAFLWFVLSLYTRQNNRILFVSPVAFKDGRIELRKLNEKKGIKVIRIDEVDQVKIEREDQFTFKSPHHHQSSYGKLQIHTRDNHQYESGFVENPEEAKEAIERFMIA